MEKTLGMKIRELRKQNGMNQTQFACKVGVASSAVSNWEKDRYEPREKTLSDIATAFKVPLTYFGVEEKEEIEEPTNIDLGVNYFLLKCYKTTNDKDFLEKIKKNLGV